MGKIVSFFTGGWLQSAIGFVSGALLAFAAFETFDRFIDDPAIRQAARTEMQAEVLQATEEAKELARIERQLDRAIFDASIKQLTAQISERETEIESLIDDFNARTDARDPSGIDGRFVR